MLLVREVLGGPFYRPGTTAGAMLAQYAEHFDTIECDATYYSRVEFERVQKWHEVLPDGFLLSAKLWRRAFLGGDDPRELVADWMLEPIANNGEVNAHLAELFILGPKSGPIVVQLPWTKPGIFKDLHSFLGRLAPFLGSLPVGHRYAVEVRNRGFLHPELLAVLRQHRVALVLSEVRGMPHPADVAERTDVLTTDWWYARLIGDRSKVDRITKTFDKVVLDQSVSLGRRAHLIRTLASSADGFVYANNHFAGHGPATIAELRRLVESPGQ